MEFYNHDFLEQRLPTLEDIYDPRFRARWSQHQTLLHSVIPSPPLNPRQRKRMKVETGLEPEPESRPGNLDDNAVIEIISRVPWRYICQFKSVSFHWLSLINSFDFFRHLELLSKKEPEILAGMFYQKSITSDNKNSKFTPAGMFYQKNTSDDHGRSNKIRFEFSPFFPNKKQEEELKDRGLNALIKNLEFFPTNFRIEGCSHGLLLCSQYNELWPHGFSVDKYYVSNPISDKYFWLAEPPDPTCLHMKTGFIVDEESGHYWVIRIPYAVSLDKGLIVVHLYSSRTNSWKIHEYKTNSLWDRQVDEYVDKMFDHWYQSFYPSIVIFGYNLSEGPQVQMGKSVYWMGKDYMVVYCNIEQQEIGLINPPKFNKRRGTPCLGEFKGVLQYFVSEKEVFKLWEFRLGQWELVFEGLVSLIKQALCAYTKITGVLFKEHYDAYQPLALHHSDPWVVFFKLETTLIMYNFVGNKVEMHTSVKSELGGVPTTVYPYFLPKFPTPMC